MLDITIFEEAFMASKEAGINAIAERYNNLSAQVETAKEQEKTFAEYRKGIEAEVVELEAYIAKKLEIGTSATEEHEILIKLGNPSVEVSDESLIPQQFIVQKPSVDKRAILSALKAGKDVNGCALVRKTKVTVK